MATDNVVALAKVDPVQREASRAFEPANLDEAYRLAKILVAGRLLPKSVQTPEAAFTVIATGRELGLTAMQSLRSIHVFDGKPILSADLLLALAKKYPACKYFRLVETTAERAVYETLREGEPEATRMAFTIEEAQHAGLLGKDNWKKYPTAMLRARCIAALARAVYPDAFMGVYEEDELVPVAPTHATAPLPRIDVELQVTPAAPAVAAIAANDGPVSENSEDRWATFAQKMIDEIAAAKDVAGLTTWLSRIKTIPEPFLTPVKEAYVARKKTLLAGGAR